MIFIRYLIKPELLSGAPYKSGNAPIRELLQAYQIFAEVKKINKNFKKPIKIKKIYKTQKINKNQKIK